VLLGALGAAGDAVADGVVEVARVGGGDGAIVALGAPSRLLPCVSLIERPGLRVALGAAEPELAPSPPWRSRALQVGEQYRLRRSVRT
jgi:hypothetical protein